MPELTNLPLYGAVAQGTPGHLQTIVPSSLAVSIIVPQCLLLVIVAGLCYVSSQAPQKLDSSAL